MRDPNLGIHWYGRAGQLQWISRKAPRSDRHPVGVATTYRAYCRDTVFEMEPVDEPTNVNSLGYRPSMKTVMELPGDDDPPLNLIQAFPREGIRPQVKIRLLLSSTPLVSSTRLLLSSTPFDLSSRSLLFWSPPSPVVSSLFPGLWFWIFRTFQEDDARSNYALPLEGACGGGVERLQRNDAAKRRRVRVP